MIPDREEKDPEEQEHFLHKAKCYLSAMVEQMHTGLVAPALAQLELPITWSVTTDTDVAAGLDQQQIGDGHPVYRYHDGRDFGTVL